MMFTEQTKSKQKGELKTYETVKVVNGYAIERMVGTRGYYHLRLGKGKEIIFRTIKAAAEYAATL